MARALKLYPAGGKRVVVLRYPLDFSFAVRRFLNAVRPSVVGLIELEVWPNFIASCHRRGIPVDIINGRMTERSFKRYIIVRPIMRRMLQSVRHIGVQSETIAERFRRLGADPKRMEVLPTTKYDTADISRQIGGSDALAVALGIEPTHRLFTAGSTGPGEESVLLDAYQSLLPDFENLRLCIAPRKPEVYAQVADEISRRGLTVLRRSSRPDGAVAPPLKADEVILLDTFGELKKLYAISAGIFSGRSLLPLGGSDMIEAVALGRPVCFGPYIWNFADVVELLRRADGAVEVSSGADLRAVFERWLRNPEAAAAMADRGREAMLAMRGSSHRYARLLVQGL